MSRLGLFVLVGLVVGLLPDLALACPVCGTAPERSQKAYLGMTIFMSLFPLAMLGGLTWFVVRKVREDERAPDSAEPR